MYVLNSEKNERKKSKLTEKCARIWTLERFLYHENAKKKIKMLQILYVSLQKNKNF